MGRAFQRRHVPWSWIVAAGALSALLFLLSGCVPSAEDLAKVEYAPIAGLDWEVSTPAAEGLDPQLVAALYYYAEKVETIEALLVIKDGVLIAEKYFGDGGIDRGTRIQSATKSFTSALVGIAIDQGYLSGVDQRMMEFFPELEGQIRDPRKNGITIRQLLEMRAGYPWEESTSALFDLLYTGFRASTLIDVPLVRDPGSGFDYSNVSSHILGLIVARATGMDLKDYAEANLLSPIGAQVGQWTADWEGNRNGHADMYMTARDMAKFGLLYLNEGTWNGEEIVPGWWVRASLRSYTDDAWYYRIGKNYEDVGYGYQWWSAQAGEHRFNFAWGHGGQQITLVADQNMVIVVKADPLFGQHGGAPWRREKENLNLVADFIAQLP